jgi:hypothetical protein
METFESVCWKMDMLALHLKEFCLLKLKNLFFIILTSGQILVPCQFLGYRVLNDANSLKFLVNLLKLLLTYFLISLLYNGYRIFPGGKAAGAW